METFGVRDYRPADWAEVEALWVATGMGGAYRGDTPEVVERTLAAGARLLVMAEGAQGRIVGTAWITHDNRRSYLHHFGIVPELQGQKLAHRLMTAVLVAVQEMGFQCKLEVHDQNDRAINLYRAYGFIPLGDYRVHIKRDIDATERS